MRLHHKLNNRNIRQLLGMCRVCLKQLTDNVLTFCIHPFHFWRMMNLSSNCLTKLFQIIHCFLVIYITVHIKCNCIFNIILISCVFPEEAETGIFIQLVICREFLEILFRAGHNAGDQRVYYNLGCQCNKTLLVVIFLFRITFHLFKAAQITFAHDRNQDLTDFPAHCFSRHCPASQCVFQIVMPLCNFIRLCYYKALK